MRRSIFWMVGVVALGILLASATIIGRQLLDNQVSGGSESELVVTDSGMVKRTVKQLSQTQKSSKLPSTSPDVSGVITRRQDNTLIVGTGNLTFTRVNMESFDFKASHDGPEVEVVLTRDTIVYRDATIETLGEEGLMQPHEQILTLASLDEIGSNATLSAWGVQTGDRLVAEVIVYYPG